MDYEESIREVRKEVKEAVGHGGRWKSMRGRLGQYVEGASRMFRSLKRMIGFSDKVPKREEIQREMERSKRMKEHSMSELRRYKKRWMDIYKRLGGGGRILIVGLCSTIWREQGKELHLQIGVF